MQSLVLYQLPDLTCKMVANLHSLLTSKSIKMRYTALGRHRWFSAFSNVQDLLYSLKDNCALPHIILNFITEGWHNIIFYWVQQNSLEGIFYSPSWKISYLLIVINISGFHWLLLQSTVLVNFCSSWSKDS